MGTVPTQGNTNYSSLMAQQNAYNTQTKAMQLMIDELSKKIQSGGNGGDGGDCNRNHNKTPAIRVTRE